ncbi:ATP12 family chaperone protein [Paracoccus sediminicola]|uniref:ATP12 family chaperone protein n=1 Tax=Paracoccus sediminicola TaxID=3017783 RepID=UPI0022F021CC|nr:ATP12 family protein [Paracoccus sediminicola]WBU57633.1 ATPase [Paracoccus sediminicola]
MSEWKARRFWKQADAEPAEGGFRVALDGRPVMTPGKQRLILPTAALAEAVAEEWDAQGDVIDPLSMPLTRAANSAIEKVTPQFDAVADMLAAYGGTDLLCYRAADPEELRARQEARWNPLLDWAETALGARLAVTQGVMPVAQDADALTRLRDRIGALDPFRLTGLHDLVTLPGSLILGLAVKEGRLSAAEAHELSRIDEEYQAEIWGRDEEADTAAANRREAMQQAARFLGLLNS